MAFFQRKVEETGISRRRSFRKYRISSNGRLIAAAMTAASGERKWGNQDIVVVEV
jgi:hypothetical protein